MDLTDVLAEARGIHDDVMDDLGTTCRIDRIGTPTFDQAQQKTVTTEEVVYTGACRVPALTPGAQTVSPSGELGTPTDPIVRVPATATGIRPNDRVTITSCPTDPQLVGKQLWVSFNRIRTLNSARYLVCRHTQGRST